MGMFGILKLVIIPVSFSKSSLPSYKKKKKKKKFVSLYRLCPPNITLLYRFCPPNITLYSWSILNKKAKKYNF